MRDAADAEITTDPLSPEAIADLPAFYRRLRDRQPVYYYADYDTFFFSRFEDVWELLRVGDNTFVATETNLPTPAYLRSHRNTGNPPPFASINPMAAGPSLPSPWYEDMRKAHNAPLKPKAVRQLSDFIEETVAARLDLLIPRGKFDIVRDFAGYVVASSVCRLFGLPQERAESLLELVNETTKPAADASVDFAVFFETLKGYIVPCVQHRRAAGADGDNALIDGLVNYRTPHGRALDDAEIADQLVCVMVGGVESASKVTGQGIFELQKRPDQLAAVLSDLEKNVPVAVDEMVRYCAPAQYTFRTVHKDISFAGHQIRAGQRVAAMLYSAARDEREFDNPDEFIWSRKIPRVISFGLGQHHCIGKHLALMEVRAMVRQFLSRVPDCEFAMDEAVRNPSYFQHGWISLPVVIK